MGNSSSAAMDTATVRPLKHDAAPGGGDGAHDGVVRVVAACAFLPVPGQDEQAVVDGQAEPHGRRQVEGEHRHVGDAGQQLQHGEGADDGEDPAEDGHEGGDDAAEHEQQHERA